MLNASTKLNAVNTLLSVIGEARVNQLGSGIDEAEEAEDVLDEISRSVQSQGWDFNTEEGVQFPLDQDSQVPLPDHVIRIDSNGRRYVRRGSFLYDKKAHTAVFQSPPRLTVAYGLDFDDMPEVAKQYITIRAARIFQAREVGSSTLNSFNKDDEQAAWLALRQYDEESADVSIFDSLDLQLALDRSATEFVDLPAGSILGTFVDE